MLDADADMRWDNGDPDDTVANPGSNYGGEIDIFAPAHVVKSAHWASNSPTSVRDKFRSGTSFSTAFVTGAAAIMLKFNPTLTPAQLAHELTVVDATTGTHGLNMTNRGTSPVSGTSPNKLLFVDYGCRTRIVSH